MIQITHSAKCLVVCNISYIYGTSQTSGLGRSTDFSPLNKGGFLILNRALKMAIAIYLLLWARIWLLIKYIIYWRKLKEFVRK